MPRKTDRVLRPCTVCGKLTISQYQICTTTKECRRAGWSRDKRAKCERDTISFMLNNARARAKKKDIEFSLTREMIIIPEMCPVFGFKLEIGHNSFNEYSPSLDRIDPAKGYIDGNVQIISNKANSMKRNATPEELKQFSRYFIGDGSN